MLIRSVTGVDGCSLFIKTFVCIPVLLLFMSKLLFFYINTVVLWYLLSGGSHCILIVLKIIARDHGFCSLEI